MQCSPRKLEQPTAEKNLNFLTRSEQDDALYVKMFCQIHSKRADFLHLVLKQAGMLHPLKDILHGHLPGLHVRCGVQLLHIQVNWTAGTL